MRAVAEDIGVDAVKIGMLGDARRRSRRSSAALDLVGDAPVVLDPVMVAESGARLLDEEAERGAARAAAAARDGGHAQPARGARARRGRREATEDADAGGASRARCTRSGPAVVVVTGGHREEATDVFFDGERLVEIPGERHPDGAAHGSGCTHSSALAAQLALGLEPLEAARRAQADRRRRRCATGCAASARAPGPVDVLGGLEPARR